MQHAPGLLLLAGCLFLIVVWGGAIRLYKLGQPSFWIDEAATVLQCRGVWSCGVPKLPNGAVNWDSFPSTYLQSLGFLVTDDPHWAVRLPSAAAGTLCIALAFLVVRVATHKNMPSLLTAVVVGLLHDQIIWSRQARPYVFAQMFTLMAFAFFLLWHSRRNLGFAILAAISAILATFCHRCGYIAPLTLAILTIAYSSGRLWRPVAMLVLLGASLVAISHWAVGSNSSMDDTIRDLLRPAETNYVADYWRYLIREYGWMLFFCPLAVLCPWRKSGGFAASLLLASILFFALLSLRTWLFAHRYIFILSPVVVILFSLGVWNCLSLLRSRRCLVNSAAVIVLILLLVHGQLSLRPRKEYDLGFTAPTPPWKEAFALVEDRHHSVAQNAESISIISAYPALTDIYLDGNQAAKYYIPINYSGHPNDVWGNPPYTTAVIVANVRELMELDAYVMLDDFALRMIADEGIRNYFATHTPNAIVRSSYNIYIWILRAKEKTEHAEQRAAHLQLARGRAS